jgi:hypothetical protein
MRPFYRISHRILIVFIYLRILIGFIYLRILIGFPIWNPFQSEANFPHRRGEGSLLSDGILERNGLGLNFDFGSSFFFQLLLPIFSKTEGEENSPSLRGCFRVSRRCRCCGQPRSKASFSPRSLTGQARREGKQGFSLRDCSLFLGVIQRMVFGFILVHFFSFSFSFSSFSFSFFFSFSFSFSATRPNFE